MIEDKKTSIGTNIQVSETLFGRIETDFDYEGQGQRIKSIQSFVGRFKKKENS